MIPELKKYIELKACGSSSSEVSLVALEDGLNPIESIYVLKHVFDLSVAHAKEIWINIEGNEYNSNLVQLFQDELDQIQKENALEHQKGNS
jgi:hypothetical protein